MSDPNPVNELIAVEKKNQALLVSIASSQQEMLAMAKAQRTQDRWKLGFEILKLIIWPVVILVSFFVLKEMMANLVPTFGGLGGGETSSGGVDLNGLKDLLKEFQ